MKKPAKFHNGRMTGTREQGNERGSAGNERCIVVVVEV